MEISDDCYSTILIMSILLKLSLIPSTVSGPRVLPSSVFPTGSFLPTNDTVWQMEFDQLVSFFHGQAHQIKFFYYITKLI